MMQGSVGFGSLEPGPLEKESLGRGSLAVTMFNCLRFVLLDVFVIVSFVFRR